MENEPGKHASSRFKFLQNLVNNGKMFEKEVLTQGKIELLFVHIYTGLSGVLQLRGFIFYI